MAFMLARLLGKTVEELLSQISSREFSEWEAFLRIEGRGVHAARTAEKPEKVENDLRAIFGRKHG